MKNDKSWVLTVEEKVFNIEYNPKSLSGRNKVMVNGSPEKLKFTFMTGFAGLDQELYLGGKVAHFVLKNGKADLAIDGYFLDSKEAYIPLPGVPKWVWLFVVACIGIPVYTLGGAVPVLIAMGAIAVCVKISISTKLNTIIKALLCTVVTGAAWGFIYIFVQWALSLV